MSTRIETAVHLARTLPRLGLFNLARVAVYRAQKQLGWVPVSKAHPAVDGVFFGGASPGATPQPVAQRLFGWIDRTYDAPPDWHVDPVAGTIRIGQELLWTEALGSVPAGAEVKLWWELSRFYWAPVLALRAAGGDTGALDTLDAWVGDWSRRNPPFRGINWSCGQEASIRVLNLALSEHILGHTDAPTPAMRSLLDAHMERIAATLHYGVGQANNHGITEAAALFVGGSWLAKSNPEFSKRMRDRGAAWLDDRALVLILPDGSPAQHSVTYHRAVLEVICLAQVWCRARSGGELSERVKTRVIAGARWLQQFTEPQSGDAPNLGANDGSHLFSLELAPYRDFRPTVALVAAVFDGASVYPDSANFERRLGALGVAKPTLKWAPPESRTYPDGGYHVLRRADAVAYFRYPVFRHRPSHSDALHVELWVDGRAMLRDGGTYSYSDASSALDATAAHNTIEFDARDQMPKIGRFLYGRWLAARDVQGVTSTANGELVAAATYTDYRDATHSRRVALGQRELTVCDEISGFRSAAVLRWRLAPGNWELQAWPDRRTVTCALTGCAFMIRIECDIVIADCRIEHGYESLRYLEKTSIPVLRVEVRDPGKICTLIRFPTRGIPTAPTVAEHVVT